MVAFAADYAPTTEAPDAQNRARGIFLAVEVRAGENGRESRHPRREKAAFGYETASGPTNFLNRDPINEWGSMWVREAEEVNWQEELNLYAFVGNDAVNNWDDLGLQRGPTLPGRPTPPPMRPPGATGPGGGIGHAIELIVDGVAFGGKLGEAKSMATLAALLGAFDELCDLQYKNHPNPASKGCGCCVMIIWVARENAAQPPSFFNPGGSPPSGGIIGVRGADLYYVPKECDSVSRSTEFPEAMWPGQNTTEFVTKKPK